MNSPSRRLLGLCLPAILACSLDNTLTLIGQSPAYWAGNCAAANEASPTFNQLLQIHPAAFAAGAIVWIALFTGILLLLPDALSLILGIAITFGHTAGAATWLLRHFRFGYQMCNALFLVTAIALGLGIRYGWRAAPPGDYVLRGWNWPMRWLVGVLLFSLGVYLFLWPR
jgi:hypothetical protein